MAASAGGQVVQRPKVPPKIPRGVPKIAADLVVDRIVLYPVNPTADDEVRVTVYLKNQGTGRGFIANGRSLYSIQLPGRAAAKVRDLTGGTWLEPGVANGFSNSLGRMSAYPPGPVGVLFAADPDNEIGESDEANNQKTVELTPLPAGRPDLLPDLTIVGIAAGPVPVAIGFPKIVELSVEVVNQGKAAATLQEGISVVSAEPVLYPALGAGESIPPGGKKTFVLKAIFAAAGTYSWTFKVDGVDAVREADENNNRRSFSLEVR